MALLNLKLISKSSEIEISFKQMLLKNLMLNVKFLGLFKKSLQVIFSVKLTWNPVFSTWME